MVQPEKRQGSEHHDVEDRHRDSHAAIWRGYAAYCVVAMTTAFFEDSEFGLTTYLELPRSVGGRFCILHWINQET